MTEIPANSQIQKLHIESDFQDWITPTHEPNVPQPLNLNERLKAIGPKGILIMTTEVAIAVLVITLVLTLL